MGARKPYLGIYGKVALKKAWCKNCGCYAFILDNERACCGRTYRGDPSRWKRESLPTGMRLLPGKALQKLILQSQEYRCLYCERRFHTHTRVKGKLLKVRIHWDHMMPFSYLQCNPGLNWAAACQVCNHWKSNLIFQTIEEVQLYVRTKWEQAQSPTTTHKMPSLPEDLSANEEMAEVLWEDVPMEGF